jgi:hypothetical protein
MGGGEQKQKVYTENRHDSWKKICQKISERKLFANVHFSPRISFLESSFYISRLTVCVTRAGAGGGTPSDWENDKA